MPKFSDIIGQDQIRDHFITAIKQDKVSHAYILSGEKYSGKQFIARIFAAAVLCEDEDNMPCGRCRSCMQAETDNNPDIIYVTHEKPNVISVDDIREQVNNDISIKPYAGKKKVYIVNEAEKMNPQAQNAILKTFEEPPEYAVILLLVTNAEDLLPTIRSRAVELNMKPVSDDVIKAFLMREEHVPDYKADTCVAFARGNLGKAKLLASSEEFDEVREDVLSLLKNIRKMDVADLSSYVKKFSDKKNQIADYLDVMLVWYRDVLLYKATGNSNSLIFQSEIQYIKKVADDTSYEGIQKIIDAINVCERRISVNVNFELTIELLLIAIGDSK